MRSNVSFGSNITPFGKRFIIFYTSIYVGVLLSEHWFKLPVVAYLQLYPLNSPFFRIWQILTHVFIHDPNAPFGFLINALMFYFFAAPIENVLGSKRFLILFYFSALGSALFGLSLSGVSGFNMPFMGMLSSLLALLIIFGLLNPEATILLMFILPVKAKYISYGTILITVLTFLAKANPSGAYHLGGMFFGYLYFRGPKKVFNPNLLYLHYLNWQLKRKKAGFRVIDGNKENKDKPTYH
jgi:membrane associated rhomboid family serine protease